MDDQFYTAKIQRLTDDKLKELLRLRTGANHEIMRIAEKEATRRGIDVSTIEVVSRNIAYDPKAGSGKDQGTNWSKILIDFLWMCEM